MTEFGVVPQVADKHISRRSATPTSQGGGAQRSPIFGTPYVHPDGLSYSDEIWYGSTIGAGVCFLRVIHAPISMERGHSVHKFLDPPTQYEKRQPNFARWSN